MQRPVHSRESEVGKIRRPAPSIATLKDFIATCPGAERIAQQTKLDALLHTADAWQTLARAGETRTAEAVDGVGGELFLDGWNSVAAEMWMRHIPDRLQMLKLKQNSNTSSESTGENAAAGVDPPSTSTVTAELERQDARPGRTEEIKSARRNIALAWDLLDSIEEDGPANAEKLWKMAVANFGDEQFRAAVSEARLRRLSRPGFLQQGA